MSINSCAPVAPCNLIDIWPHIQVKLVRQQRLLVQPIFRKQVGNLAETTQTLLDTLTALQQSQLTADDAALVDQFFELANQIQTQTTRIQSETFPK